MPDRLGYRGKWGLVTPSRNTVIESELHRIVPHGITINTARAVREGPNEWASDQAQRNMAAGLRAAEAPAIARLKDCEPDLVIIGDGAFTFTSGDMGLGLSKRYGDQFGVPVVTPSDAYWAAFQTLGVKKVAVLGPRRMEGDPREMGHWDWHHRGVDIAMLGGADCTTAFEIVNFPEDRLIGLLRELAESGAEAICATGTNFPLATLAAETERWLGIPFLHINCVLAWHAMRRSGIGDAVRGYGRLLEVH